MKKPTSIRLSSLTEKQLKDLISATGMTQTEIIAIAIDRMARSDLAFLRSHGEAKMEDGQPRYQEAL